MRLLAVRQNAMTVTKEFDSADEMLIESKEWMNQFRDIVRFFVSCDDGHLEEHLPSTVRHLEVS
jgi:hypothetical protein